MYGVMFGILKNNLHFIETIKDLIVLGQHLKFTDLILNEIQNKYNKMENSCKNEK